MLHKDLKHVPKEPQEPLWESIAAFLVAALATLLLILIMAMFDFSIR